MIRVSARVTARMKVTVGAWLGTKNAYTHIPSWVNCQFKLTVAVAVIQWSMRACEHWQACP